MINRQQSIFLINKNGLVAALIFFGCLWFSRFFNLALEDFSDGRGYKGPSAVFQLLSFFIYASSFTFLLTRKKQVVNIIIRNPVPLLLCLLCLVSSSWSLIPEVTFRRSLALFGMYSFAIMTNIFVASKGKDNDISNALVLGMFASLILILLIPSIGIAQGELVGSHNGLWQGVYGFKNALGQCMAILICLMLPKCKLWNSQLAITALASFMLVMTGATTPIVGIIVGVVCLYLIKRYQAGAKLLFWIFTVLSFIGALIIYLNIDYIVFDLIGKDFTGSGRTDIWEALLDSVKNNYLGFGYGGVFWGDNSLAYFIMHKAHVSIGHAHNGFIDARLEIGYLGLFLYGLALIFPIIKLIKSRTLTSIEYSKLIILIFLIVYTIAGSSVLRANTILLFIFFYASIQPTSRDLDETLHCTK